MHCRTGQHRMPGPAAKPGLPEGKPTPPLARRQGRRPAGRTRAEPAGRGRPEPPARAGRRPPPAGGLHHAVRARHRGISLPLKWLRGAPAGCGPCERGRSPMQPSQGGPTNVVFCSYHLLEGLSPTGYRPAAALPGGHDAPGCVPRRRRRWEPGFRCFDRDFAYPTARASRLHAWRRPSGRPNDSPNAGRRSPARIGLIGTALASR